MVKLSLVIIAVFGFVNLAYQGWAALHQTQLIRQAEPHYLLLAIACQILVYVSFLPAFKGFFAASGIEIPANSSLRLIVSGMGLAKVIPLGEYLVWRRQLGHHSNGAGIVTRFLIVLYFFMFVSLGMIFVTSESLVLWLHSDKLAQTFSSKFIAAPIMMTVAGLVIIALYRFRRVRGYLHQTFSKHLGSPLIAPWTILRELDYSLADVVILTFSITLMLLVEATTLLLCLRAMGVSASFLLVVFGYSFTRVFSLVPLLPGGVGEVEAGTTFFFAAYGYNISPVLTATVLFRFLTYWLPISIGIISYARLGHEHEPFWPLKRKPHKLKST